MPGLAVFFWVLPGATSLLSGIDYIYRVVVWIFILQLNSASPIELNQLKYAYTVRFFLYKSHFQNATFRWQMRLTFVESLAPFGKDS